MDGDEAPVDRISAHDAPAEHTPEDSAAADSAAADRAAEDPAVATVVVGVDGSVEADQAFRFAAREAALRGAELHVVHAWQFPYPGYQSGVYEPYGEMKLEAAELLSDTLARLQADTPVDVDVRTHLVEGSPAKALVDESKDAALLVVGSRGRGGFAALLLGSVSQQVVHHARCPVAVVRADG